MLRRRPQGGYQMPVRWEVLRGRFRNSYETPAPFVPGEVTGRSQWRPGFPLDTSYPSAYTPSVFR